MNAQQATTVPDTGQVVEIERTPEEDADFVAEIIALEMADLAEGEVVEIESAGGLMVTVEGLAKSTKETAKSRITPPKAPEGVSRDIGELFALFGAEHVELPKRFWFYIIRDGKCGTVTLKVIRSKGELAVIVVAAEGDLPEYLEEFHERKMVITLEVLVHPKRLGDDEKAQKARQLALELAEVRRRMSRAARSRRRDRRGREAPQS